MQLIPDWVPNIHPLIVHFPIAIVLIAVLSDLASIIMKKQTWLRYATFGLYAVSALGAIAAFLSGRQAADLVEIPPAAYPVVSEHADLALITMVVLTGYAIVRYLFLWKEWDLKTPVAVLLLIAGAVGFALVAETAEHGAELVFRYGVGVAVVQPSEHHEMSETMDNEPAKTLIFKNSSWELKSGPDTPGIFRNNFELLEGSWQNLQSEYITEDMGALMIQIPQREKFLFTAGGDLDNVQVTAQLNLDKFNGRFSLVHHAQDKENYDFFDIENGKTRLGRMEQGDLKVFDDGDLKVGNWFTMKTVGTKGHFRGYVNDKLITHGHSSDLTTGPAGFAVEGSGIILINTIETISLDKEDHEEIEIKEKNKQDNSQEQNSHEH